MQKKYDKISYAERYTESKADTETFAGCKTENKLVNPFTDGLDCNTSRNAKTIAALEINDEGINLIRYDMLQ